jgi:hypothetical protein
MIFNYPFLKKSNINSFITYKFDFTKKIRLFLIYISLNLMDNFFLYFSLKQFPRIFPKIFIFVEIIN